MRAKYIDIIKILGLMLLFFIWALAMMIEVDLINARSIAAIPLGIITIVISVLLILYRKIFWEIVKRGQNEEDANKVKKDL